MKEIPAVQSGGRQPFVDRCGKNFSFVAWRIGARWMDFSRIALMEITTGEKNVIPSIEILIETPALITLGATLFLALEAFLEGLGPIFPGEQICRLLQKMVPRDELLTTRHYIFITLWNHMLQATHRIYNELKSNFLSSFLSFMRL